jgi:hypothetical protein
MSQSQKTEGQEKSNGPHWQYDEWTAPGSGGNNELPPPHVHPIIDGMGRVIGQNVTGNKVGMQRQAREKD